MRSRRSHLQSVQSACSSDTLGTHYTVITVARMAIPPLDASRGWTLSWATMAHHLRPTLHPSCFHSCTILTIAQLCPLELSLQEVQVFILACLIPPPSSLLTCSGVQTQGHCVKFSPGTSEDNEGIKWTDWGLNPGPPTY